MLSCFHTSLLLPALLLRSVNAVCSFMVTAPSSQASLGSSLSGITPKLNRIYKFIGKTPLTALVIPSRNVALVQLYKYHHHSSEWQASLDMAAGCHHKPGTEPISLK